MPHLRLEYSANIVEQDTFEDLFTQCHSILADMLPTAIANCKSRAICAERFVAGDGSKANAFVHVEVKLLAGRSAEVLQATGQTLVAVLQDHFSQSRQQLDLNVSVEIVELSEHYYH